LELEANTPDSYQTLDPIQEYSHQPGQRTGVESKRLISVQMVNKLWLKIGFRLLIEPKIADSGANGKFLNDFDGICLSDLISDFTFGVSKTVSSWLRVGSKSVMTA
jgi:hypothetical protein